MEAYFNKIFFKENCPFGGTKETENKKHQIPYLIQTDSFKGRSFENGTLKYRNSCSTNESNLLSLFLFRLPILLTPPPTDFCIPTSTDLSLSMYDFKQDSRKAISSTFSLGRKTGLRSSCLQTISLTPARWQVVAGQGVKISSNGKL